MKGKQTMTKEQKLLINITKFLDGIAQTDLKPFIGNISKEEFAEIKAQKALALEILVRFRLSDYAC